VTYTRTLPPNPDHGFGVILKSQAKLWVDSSYTDSSSTEEEADRQSAGCRVEERREAKLGSRAALVIYLSCPGNAYGEAYEEILVLTVYRERSRSPVDYQIGMRGKTPESIS